MKKIQSISRAIKNALINNYPVPILNSDKDVWISWILLNDLSEFIDLRVNEEILFDEMFNTPLKETFDYTIKDLADGLEDILSLKEKINNEKIYSLMKNTQRILPENRGKLSLREAQFLLLSMVFEDKDIRRIFGYTGGNVNNLEFRAMKKAADALKTANLYFMTQSDHLFFLWDVLIDIYEKWDGEIAQDLVKLMDRCIVEDFEPVFYFGEEIGQRSEEHVLTGRNCRIFITCKRKTLKFLTGKLNKEDLDFWIKNKCLIKKGYICRGD